jgi:hypothetical protein
VKRDRRIDHLNEAILVKHPNKDEYALADASHRMAYVLAHPPQQGTGWYGIVCIAIDEAEYMTWRNWVYTYRNDGLGVK